MRVLQIGAAFSGAQEKLELSIHNYLKGSGHYSDILYASGASDDPNILKYENTLLNLFRRFLRKFIGKCPRFSFLSTLSIIRHIKKNRPDIVNIHVVHHGYIDYIMLFDYLAKENIPVVYTSHDMWAFTGGCYHYTNIKCDGFKTGCMNCPKSTRELDCNHKKTSKYFSLKKSLFEKIPNLCFVSVSPWVNSQFRMSHLAQYENYTIMNSVDDEESLKEGYVKNSLFTIIGVAANWDDQKGIYDFFKLAQELNDKCEIVLVGNIRDELKNTAPKNIRFAGSINDKKQLYELYGTSDLHVSMSREETFGLTFVEAAYAGIKTVGFDSTAIPFVLEKTYGYIIKQDDFSSVVKQIEYLIDNRNECLLDEEQKNQVKAFFSSENMAKKYLDVYTATLKYKIERLNANE